MILLRDKYVVGPRQVSATTYIPTGPLVETFLETARAMQAHDIGRIMQLAKAFDADFAVVPWQVGDSARVVYRHEF
jgi:hypothetical protein